MTLQIVQDEAADEVLSTSPFALLCGILLQEQVSVEVAFSGPAKILDRFGSLSPAAIEAAPAEEFAELCAADPAIHPYPDSMSVLIQAAARSIVVTYAGEAETLWETAESGEELLSRLTALPGISKRKAQMFVALLGKQMGIRPAGWEQAAGPFARPDVHRSVADVRDPESLAKVQTVAASRRRNGPKAASGAMTNKKPSHHNESKGVATMKTDEEKAEQAERMGARKTARKAAKRAAKKAAAAGAVAGESGVDAEAGSPAAGPGARRTGAKRAGVKAKKAAKRAAKRAAHDPDAPAGKGARGGGRGAKKAAAGRNARKRAAAGEAGATDESATPDSPAVETEQVAGAAPDGSGEG